MHWNEIWSDNMITVSSVTATGNFVNHMSKSFGMCSNLKFQICVLYLNINVQFKIVKWILLIYATHFSVFVL